MSGRTIIGLGLLALMTLCAIGVVKNYPFTDLAPAATAMLDVKLIDGKVVMSGKLPNQAAKDRVIAQADTFFGAANYLNRLTVGGATGGESWMTAALNLLPLANRSGEGGGVSINGNAVTLWGQVPNEDARMGLKAQATTAAGGLILTDKLTILAGSPSLAAKPVVGADAASLAEKPLLAASAAPLPPFVAKRSKGKVTLDGTVPDQTSMDKILATAKEAFGAGKSINNLKIAEPESKVSWPADGVQKILGWLVFLDRFGSKGELSFNGQSATVSGEVATADIKNRLLDEMRAVPGTKIEINDNITVVESRLSEDEAKAQASLKQLLLKGIEFESSKDKITRAGAAVLDEIAVALKQNENAKIEVSGHTDSRGAAKANQRLSQRRAASVKKYLTRKGVARNRMTPRGYGSTQPIADNTTDNGRARNRRIEFRVIPKAAK